MERKTKNSASTSACSLQKRTHAFGWPQNYCASQSDQLTKLQVVLLSLNVSLSNNMAPKHEAITLLNFPPNKQQPVLSYQKKIPHWIYLDFVRLFQGNFANSDFQLHTKLRT